MTQNTRRTIFVVVAIGFIAFLFYVPHLLVSAPPPSPAPVNRELSTEELVKEIEGVVVCQRPDGIYITTLGSNEEKLLAEKGFYPRWSPDGKYVAYLSGREVMRVPREGGKQERLATLKKPAVALAYGSSGNEVFISDGEIVRAIAVRSRAMRKVISGYEVRELDIGRGGERLAATIKSLGFHIRAFDLSEHKEWKISNGCSVSFSPDAQLVTNNSLDHSVLFLRDWSTGQVVKTVDAPPNHTFDNQSWSNNEDWIASINDDGEENNVWIHQVSTNKASRVTTSGDCDRPDLYVDRVVPEEEPSPTPTPSASPTPSPSASASPSPSPTESPSPSPTESPSPSPTESPSLTPSASPVAPAATETPSPTASPYPEAAVSPLAQILEQKPEATPAAQDVKPSLSEPKEQAQP